ncbi:MAG: polysaccharide biosynthesis protein, partial [Clostridia bacterium]|nr:polysaccharide biosynthesis protein [Clostridia bacterium]
MGIHVLSSDEATKERLEMLGIREIVFALPNMDAAAKKELFEHYKQIGCKIKVYDYPLMHTADNSKRRMREFDIEDLL